MKQEKTKTEKYGIMGKSSFERDKHRFVTRLVIIQESGLFAGAPPLEMRIRKLIPFNDKEWGMQETARLNRKTDLPFYLAEAKVRVDPMLRKVTDNDLITAGISPLTDNTNQEKIKALLAACEEAKQNLKIVNTCDPSAHFNLLILQLEKAIALAKGEK